MEKTWTDSQKNLNKFLKDLNEFYPNLKSTYEKPQVKINFLDLVIKISDGKIITDLHCKSMDIHQYLRYDLCHGGHIKKSKVFSQALQLKRLYSQTTDLDFQQKKLQTGLAKEDIHRK